MEDVFRCPFACHDTECCLTFTSSSFTRTSPMSSRSSSRTNSPPLLSILELGRWKRSMCSEKDPNVLLSPSSPLRLSEKKKNSSFRFLPKKDPHDDTFLTPAVVANCTDPIPSLCTRVRENCPQGNTPPTLFILEKMMSEGMKGKGDHKVGKVQQSTSSCRIHENISTLSSSFSSSSTTSSFSSRSSVVCSRKVKFTGERPVADSFGVDLKTKHKKDEESWCLYSSTHPLSSFRPEHYARKLYHSHSPEQFDRNRTSTYPFCMDIFFTSSLPKSNEVEDLEKITSHITGNARGNGRDGTSKRKRTTEQEAANEKTEGRIEQKISQWTTRYQMMLQNEWRKMLRKSKAPRKGGSFSSLRGKDGYHHTVSSPISETGAIHKKGNQVEENVGKCCSALQCSVEEKTSSLFPQWIDRPLSFPSCHGGDCPVLSRLCPSCNACGVRNGAKTSFSFPMCGGGDNSPLGSAFPFENERNALFSAFCSTPFLATTTVAAADGAPAPASTPNCTMGTTQALPYQEGVLHTPSPQEEKTRASTSACGEAPSTALSRISAASRERLRVSSFTTRVSQGAVGQSSREEVAYEKEEEERTKRMRTLVNDFGVERETVKKVRKGLTGKKRKVLTARVQKREVPSSSQTELSGKKRENGASPSLQGNTTGMPSFRSVSRTKDSAIEDVGNKTQNAISYGATKTPELSFSTPTRIRRSTHAAPHWIRLQRGSVMKAERQTREIAWRDAIRDAARREEKKKKGLVHLHSFAPRSISS